MEIAIVLFCVLIGIPFRAMWERQPGIDAEKGAPLSKEVCDDIAEMQKPAGSNAGYHG